MTGLPLPAATTQRATSATRSRWPWPTPTSWRTTRSALIRVEYEVLPAVTDPVAARQPDAPVLHPDRPTGNLLKHIKVRHGDLEAGFAAADVIVERTYRTPMTEHAFLEPECSVAVPAGFNDPRYGPHDKLTIYVGSQIPYADRDQVARCLGLPEERCVSKAR
jgi:CO/xanthine dehydrogenase Mo-binding subunit